MKILKIILTETDGTLVDEAFVITSYKTLDGLIDTDDNTVEETLEEAQQTLKEYRGSQDDRDGY